MIKCCNTDNFFLSCRGYLINKQKRISVRNKLFYIGLAFHKVIRLSKYNSLIAYLLLLSSYFRLKFFCKAFKNQIIGMVYQFQK